MCGIAGFWSNNASVGETELSARVKRMAAALRHRGPDDGGVWVDAEIGIALGHRRLSIIDLSPLGHQPMSSADDRYVVVFNGEIYNFKPLRRELENEGYRFRGHSDTEVLIGAVSRWGMEKALERFNGMFAFALWDRRERCLYLARDRLGEKPLYYGWAGDAFLFGSELKALCAHPAWVGNINRESVALFTRYNYIPAPHSIYRDVYKLKPGTVLSLTAALRERGVRADLTGALKPYWTLAHVVEAGAHKRFRGSADEAVDELERLLRASIGGQMIADVPVGALLSGGVDSSLVVSLMQAQSMRAVKTFTVGFHEGGYDEARHAAAVAKHLGTEHTELYVTPQEALAVIPDLPVLFDEPFADSTQIPNFLISRLARRSVTVALTGDGGDELFGGYSRYPLAQRLWSRIGWMPGILRNMGARTIKMVSPQRWSRALRALGGERFAGRNRVNPGDRLHKLAEILSARKASDLYLGLVSHWLNPEEVVRGATAPRHAPTDDSYQPPDLTFVERMMYMDSLSYLPDDILTKVDRAAMGVSLEARVPMLDHRIVAFAWRLSPSLKLHGRQGKWLSRKLLYRYVPEALVNRPKQGFSVPIGAWLRGPLREWAESLLSEDCLNRGDVFNPQPVRRKWNEHLSGQRNWEGHLWDVLMFQSWLEENRQRSDVEFRANVLTV